MTKLDSIDLECVMGGNGGAAVGGLVQPPGWAYKHDQQKAATCVENNIDYSRDNYEKQGLIVLGCHQRHSPRWLLNEPTIDPRA